MNTHRRVSSTCGTASSFSRSARNPSAQSFQSHSTCPTSVGSFSRASICLNGEKHVQLPPIARQDPRSVFTPPSGLYFNPVSYDRRGPSRDPNGLSYRRSHAPGRSGSDHSSLSPHRLATRPSPLSRSPTASVSPAVSTLPTASASTLSSPAASLHTAPAHPSPLAQSIQASLESLDCEYPSICDPIDKREHIPKWQIWVQRLIFLALVVGANLACAVAAFESSRHAWVLALLVFIKSKDILSTFAGMYGAARSSLRDHSKTEESPKWILSLICAYKETEGQIMKTVNSTLSQDLGPHKQVLCLIMDGTPGPIRDHFTALALTMRRPYLTWQAARGELIIHAGWMREVPVILIEKSRNAGKKDSLILGHSLFNHPSKDAPLYTLLLRDELFHKVLPRLTSSDFQGFDFVFCTDADSTLHEHAMHHLAKALSRDTNAIAACGALFADLAGPEVEWTTWHLFQQFQYSFGQYVRRRAEGVWGRVTCLPGCITMIAVRPEFAAALKQYAAPVENRCLLPHQVQYLGTDRRLTWSMLIQDVNLRTLFVPEATSETVAPQTLDHYLSQRRRWASNAYFNDFYYAFGPNQRLITRIFSLIDLVRLTLVFYRVINTAVFIRFLVSNFYIIRIVPLLIVTKLPVAWFTINVLFKRPILRRRLHKLLFGLCIDQIISPFLSVIVFINVVFRMGSPVWGKTGVSTEAAPMVGPPLLSMLPEWAPDRLNALVRDVVRSRKEELPSMVQVQTHRSI